MPGLKRSKPSKGPPSSAGKRYPNKPNTRHSRTQKATTRPQQWLKGTPRPQQWLLIGVQGCQGAYLQGATSRCLRSKRPYVCLAVRLPLSLYSTPPPIRGVGGTWALAHFIIPEIHSFVNLSKSQSSDTSDMRSICAKLLLLSLPVLFDLARGA